jgi:single-strand DNA-binding protein
MNVVILIGRLTQNPTLRMTPTGSAVCVFSLALNETFKADGEKRQTTTYVDCEAWGQNGQFVSDYLRQGDMLSVRGSLRLDSWMDKQSGQKRSKMRVVCFRCESLAATRGTPETTSWATAKRPSPGPPRREEPRPAAAPGAAPSDPGYAPEGWEDQLPDQPPLIGEGPEVPF